MLDTELTARAGESYNRAYGVRCSYKYFLGRSHFCFISPRVDVEEITLSHLKIAQFRRVIAVCSLINLQIEC